MNKCINCKHKTTMMNCITNDGQPAVLSHCSHCNTRHVSVNQQGNGVIDAIKTMLSRIANFISGRKPGAPELMRFIGAHGLENITEMVVCREPIKSAITSLLNIVTLGAYNRLTKSNSAYDRLFHLFIVFKTESGMYQTERNEVVRVFPSRPAGEMVAVNMNGRTVTVGDFFTNAISREGDNIFVYDAFRNNCQKFVTSLLLYNGFMTRYLQTFITQDLNDLMKGLPSYTPALARGLTDLAARLQILAGRGKKKKKTYAKNIHE